jgi:hypothetical protein
MDKQLEQEIKDLQLALEELKPELVIDSNNLEEECRQQPEKYEAIGQIATRAKSLARQAKDTLDFTEANIRAKVRSNPEEHKLGKVTADAVNDVVTIHPDMVQAKQDYIEVSQIADGFNILVQSMDQRKAMIRDLVSLFIHKYYANSTLSGEEKSLDETFEDDLAQERSRDIEAEK